MSELDPVIVSGEGAIPIVANIPHSSTHIPEDLRETILLNDDELQDELKKMTDWHVDKLFSFIPEQGGISVKFNSSRLIVDPERFEDDAKEIMASRGMGVIYTKTSDGHRLRNDPTAEERQALLYRFYHPYHDALTQAVQTCLDKFDKCLIFDCHSYPKDPLPYELDQSADRPEICLGTNPFHTPDDVAEKYKSFFEKQGYRVTFNTPFAGTFVPTKFYERDERVSSLMIEVRRDVYLREQVGDDAIKTCLLKYFI